MCQPDVNALLNSDATMLLSAYAAPNAANATGSGTAPTASSSSPVSILRWLSGEQLEGSDVLMFQHPFQITFDFNQSRLEQMRLVPVALLNITASPPERTSSGNATAAAPLVAVPSTSSSRYEWLVRLSNILPTSATLADLTGMPLVVSVTALARFNSTCVAPLSPAPSASPPAAPSGYVDRLITFACTLVFPPAPVVSATTQAATQAAIATSVAASVVAGPSSASDIPSMVLMTLARCTLSGAYVARQPGGYKLVTPFAMSDTARGALAGNALALVAVFAVTGIATVACRLLQKKSWREAMSTARFPGIPLIFCASMHQSTLFCGVRLCSSDSTGPLDVFIGRVAILLCVLVPLGVLVAVARVPRQFLRYDVAAPSSIFAAFPLRLLVPLGETFPRETRQMASSLITNYISPSVLFASIPFLSSFVTNVVALLPESTPANVCNGMMYASAVLHVAIALFIGFSGIFRHKSSTLFGVCGLLLTASFHAQLASNMRSAIDTTMSLQAGFSLFRSAVSLVIGAAEQRMFHKGTIQAKTVLWTVEGKKPAGNTAAESPSGNLAAGLLLDDAGSADAGQQLLQLVDSFASAGVLTLHSTPALSSVAAAASFDDSMSAVEMTAVAEAPASASVEVSPPLPPPPSPTEALPPAVNRPAQNEDSDLDLDLDATLGSSSEIPTAAMRVQDPERLTETDLVGDTFAPFALRSVGQSSSVAQSSSVDRALMLFASPLPAPAEGLPSPPQPTSRNHEDDERYL